MISHSEKIASEKGSMMLESVMCLPLLLALIFGSLQLAHIWFARQVVHYAAYAAARSTLTEPNDKSMYEKAARSAAERVCAWTALSQPAGAEGITLPGWGHIPGSGNISDKVKIDVDDSDQWNPSVTVTFDFPLVMPIAGPIIGWAVNPWDSGSEWLEKKADVTGNAHGGEDVRYPYIRFKETVAVTKPYVMLK
jgi:Flp pilus assembly protein TadG